jgi:hypothetical protein
MHDFQSDVYDFMYAYDTSCSKWLVCHKHHRALCQSSHGCIRAYSSKGGTAMRSEETLDAIQYVAYLADSAYICGEVLISVQNISSPVRLGQVS